MRRIRCTAISMKHARMGATRFLNDPENVASRLLRWLEVKFVLARKDVRDGALLMPVPPFQKGHHHTLKHEGELLLHIALAMRIRRKIEQTENGAAFAGSVHELETRR